MRADTEGVDEPVVGDYRRPAGSLAAAPAAGMAGHREVDLDLELLADLLRHWPPGISG